MEPYSLVPTTEEILSTIYRWTLDEPNPENYSCRPVERYPEGKYIERWQKFISDPNRRSFVLLQGATPVGKVNLFDYNPRNRSAEFGYYLPERYRFQGIGTEMVKRFLVRALRDRALELNKLIATTSSGNLCSLRLLEKLGFHLDGRQREHYWIAGERFDQLIYSLLKTEFEMESPAEQ